MRTDFFLVGTAKAGTSALHEYLSRQHEVCMCTLKEPNFFSHTEIEAQGLYYRKSNVESETAYHRLFHPTSSSRLFGESSVSYLFYPGVAARIHRYNPNSKILICLREPVSRAFSHYCMDYALGLVTDEFAAVWNNGEKHPRTGQHFQQYFLISDYPPQIERYNSVFPENQVLIILYEDLCTNPDKTLDRVSRFIGLENRDPGTGLTRENVSGLAKSGFIRWLYTHQALRKTIRQALSGRLRNQLKSLLFSKSQLPKLPEGLRLELQEHYEPMKDRLQQMTGLDLKCWSDRVRLELAEPTT